MPINLSWQSPKINHTVRVYALFPFGMRIPGEPPKNGDEKEPKAVEKPQLYLAFEQPMSVKHADHFCRID